MRLRETFSVYKRKLKSGKIVFYYQIYDDDGNRICGHSTGKRTKTAARNYCNQLLREGRLMPQPHEIPTFEKFAKGWWEWDTCPYLKKRRGRREITKSYAKSAWRRLHTHILPYFGKKRLDRITEFDIDTWLTSYAEKGIRNNTANTFLNILVTMLNEAVRQKIIKANPALLVMKLKKDTKAIDILKANEVKKVFPENWRKVWGDEYIAYVANKLAACTGMRFGEVLGLRGEFVHEDYIRVCAQYTAYGYVDTKTHDSRNVPIPLGIQHDLEQLKKINGNGFLFSSNGGRTPLLRVVVYEAFYTALKNIGIDETERKRRNISFHGWRHFFNTTLRMANVADSKVMSVTGHKTQGMTEHYTHFDSAQFTEVRQVQEAVLLPAPKRGRPKQDSAGPATKAARGGRTARETSSRASAKARPRSGIPAAEPKRGGSRANKSSRSS
jgi:integrase